MCEEFGGFPSAAYREWLNAPAGLLEDIIELRAYAQAKRIYDTTEKKDRPWSPLMQLVEEIDCEIAKEELDARVDAAADN